MLLGSRVTNETNYQYIENLWRVQFSRAFGENPKKLSNHVKTSIYKNLIIRLSSIFLIRNSFSYYKYRCFKKIPKQTEIHPSFINIKCKSEKDVINVFLNNTMNCTSITISNTGIIGKNVESQQNNMMRKSDFEFFDMQSLLWGGYLPDIEGFIWIDNELRWRTLPIDCNEQFPDRFQDFTIHKLFKCKTSGWIIFEKNSPENVFQAVKFEYNQIRHGKRVPDPRNSKPINQNSLFTVDPQKEKLYFYEHITGNIFGLDTHQQAPVIFQNQNIIKKALTFSFDSFMGKLVLAFECGIQIIDPYNPKFIFFNLNDQIQKVYNEISELEHPYFLICLHKSGELSRIFNGNLSLIVTKERHHVIKNNKNLITGIDGDGTLIVMLYQSFLYIFEAISGFLIRKIHTNTSYAENDRLFVWTNYKDSKSFVFLEILITLAQRKSEIVHFWFFNDFDTTFSSGDSLKRTRQKLTPSFSMPRRKSTDASIFSDGIIEHDFEKKIHEEERRLRSEYGTEGLTDEEQMLIALQESLRLQ